MHPLLQTLGAVCAGCATWSAPGTPACAGCGAPLRSAQREPVAARLELLRGRAVPQGPWSLASPLGLGRSRGAVRFPADTTLAPLAATIEPRGGGWALQAEAPGVFVRIGAPTRLAPGERFAVGDQVLRLAACLPGERIELERLHGDTVAERWVRAAPLRIGRRRGEILLPDDPHVSALHCELAADGLLADLGSSNGTFVELAPGREQRLLPGDALRIGANVLRLGTASR